MNFTFLESFIFSLFSINLEVKNKQRRNEPSDLAYQLFATSRKSLLRAAADVCARASIQWRKSYEHLPRLLLVVVRKPS